MSETSGLGVFAVLLLPRTHDALQLALSQLLKPFVSMFHMKAHQVHSMCQAIG